MLHELPARYSLIFVLFHLGEVHTELGQVQEAHQVWTEALALAKLGDHPLTEQLKKYLNEP